jgi:hypothetical protein
MLFHAPPLRPFFKEYEKRDKSTTRKNAKEQDGTGGEKEKEGNDGRLKK